MFVFHITCYFCDSRMSKVYIRIASSNGKYMGLGLNGAERTTINIVDILNIIQKARAHGIHLKIDEETKSSRGPQKRSERQVGRERMYTCCLKAIPLACSITPTLSQLTKASRRLDMCVCVCCHPIYSGHQACGRTNRGHTTGGRSHRISHPPSFCGACLSFSRE